MLMLAACGGNASASVSPSSTSTSSGSESASAQTSDDPRPVDCITISEVIASAKGTAVTFRGYYMGNSLTAVYSGVEQYNSIFLADGDQWIQCYQVTKSVFPSDLVVGETILQIVGTTAHYSKNGGTTPEVKPVTAATIVHDSQVTKPSWIEVKADTAAVAQADVNKGYEVKSCVVVSKSANSYGNVTITFTVGAGTAIHTLYLDSRYTDVTVEGIANLVVGDSFACKTFAGVNTGANPATYQFIYALDFVRTAA